MGSMFMSGISKELTDKLSLDFSQYPQWVNFWIPACIDLFCKLASDQKQCRLGWREYLPDSLTGPGQVWSEEFEIVTVTDHFVKPITFEEFQTERGFDVTKGTGFLAGLQGASTINEWFSSLYEYLFHTDTTALATLFTPSGLGTVFLLAIFIRSIKAACMPRFQNIGRNAALKAHGDAWLNENEIRITKFGEYVFRLCYHSFISLVGLYFFWDAPWWDKSKGGTVNLYTNFPQDPVKPSMAWYYLFQAAYNVDAMFSLLEISLKVKIFPNNSRMPMTIRWADTVRGDFNEMMVHHIVTNALVFLSSHFRQTRIGSMVFWMHDISDVPVDLAKLANFVKWHKATAAAFGLLCVMWFITRLYVLPVTIWLSVFTESAYLCEGNPAHFQVYYYGWMPIFLVLLAALIGLHVVWFSMFIEMAYKLIKHNEAVDVSVEPKKNWFSMFIDMAFRLIKHGKTEDKERKEDIGTHTNGKAIANGTKKKVT